MRGWMFILLFAGLLLMAPSHAYKGGIIENNPDASLLLVVGLVVVALAVRPAENGWVALAGDGGCVTRLLTGLLWLFVGAFALWLMAGAPNGGGL